MNIGTLRDRISIEAETVVIDPKYGPQPAAWVAVHSRIAANVQDSLPSRAESVEQGFAIAANRTRVRFRYRPGITSAMRVIVHGADDRTLQIIGGPAILGNRQGIEIMCEEYSTQGGA
ncbi:head-tail adaptor protein [Castellaniella hirudinis]|uniref:head-tail adaptor protein n=1 Tax=Castellaniella hirudinis TaxID=1144617 RepID=UPI0039C0FE6F